MNTIFKTRDDEAASEPGQLLPEMVYQRLRLQILNGELTRGQLLRQEELAQRFNVSRVPLREALSRLEADGLIVLRPRRGYAVSALDQKDIVEVFDLRAVVEEHAGHLAALSRTPSDVARVGEILERMEALDRNKKDHFSEWFRCNRDFHAHMLSAAKRPRVAKLAGTLRDAVEPYIRAEAEHRRVGNVRDADIEHREMFEAFKAGDARGLADLSRQHVERAAARLLRGLRKHAAKTPQR
ncbi:MAG: GntR family transcriptional regulator [Alphaproteobacteria bacterium]|nr:GntR family transcriptional regulator [Alphaproteobacteria bacterium]